MEEPILNDEEPQKLIVDFGYDNEYSDSCSKYKKCSFIKKSLLSLPDNTLLKQIEIEYYVDYSFDLDDKVIEEVFLDLKKDIITGIETLKRMKCVPKWAYRQL